LLPNAAERDRILERVAQHGDAVDDSTVRDPSGNALVLAF
jgi:hypothetical protein